MNFQTIFTSLETRMIVLPNGENRMIIASFVSTKHRMAGRTAGRSDHSIYSGQLCQRAVTNLPSDAQCDWSEVADYQLRNFQPIFTSLFTKDYHGYRSSAIFIGCGS